MHKIVFQKRRVCEVNVARKDQGYHKIFWNPFTVNSGQLRTLRTPSGPADSLGTCEDPRDLQSLKGPAESIAPNNGRLFRSNLCKA